MTGLSWRGCEPKPLLASGILTPKKKNDGDYGSGDPDDLRTGFESYVLHAPSGSICDTLNSDLITVNEESDDDGFYAWDEVGERNMKWIAAIHNAFPAILSERQAMLAKLEAAKRLRNSIAMVPGLLCPAEMRECIDKHVAAFDKETA